jgi:DNA (cytosine-5)-methyltransferase 1
MNGEIVVNNFAGASGASEGIRWVLGRSPDIAINHWDKAIAMHAANHPDTEHLCEDVFVVDPVAACRGRAVGGAWFSPDCTDFSKAKNAKPRSQKIRGLAWVVVKWARLVRPRVIFLENVEEFEGWGPLDDNNQRIPEKSGHTFRQWVGRLKALGYVVEWRNLRACDYGSPTNRKRLFLIARCDGQPIFWPTPTHGPGTSRPHRSSHEIVDWSLPFPSIFERKKSLAEPTLRRIATGIRRHVLDAREPFIVGNFAATMIHTGNGEREGQAPRVYDLHKPINTIVAQGVKQCVVAAFMTKHYGGVIGHDMHRPIGTITAQDHHAVTTCNFTSGDHESASRALIEKYAPARRSPSLFDMIEDRQERTIYDIGTRMLGSRELFDAQGFPRDYKIDVEHNGKPLTSKDLNRLAGNAVCPHVAAALFAANVSQRAEVAA